MKIASKQFLSLAGSALLIFATQQFTYGDTFVFDPDGAGNSPKLNLSTFQFGAVNSVARAALPFTQGNPFQLVFQGQLNSIVTSSGAQLTPTGLNATGAVGAVVPFAITIVGSVTEAVTNANAGTPPRVVYRLTNAQVSPFIEIYYDSAVNANPLAGTGYNDGKLILAGTPNTDIVDVGTISLSNPQPSPQPNFDSFGTNDYATAGTGNANITSVVATGATTLSVTVNYVDPAFFVTPGSGDTGRRVKAGALRE